MSRKRIVVAAGLIWRRDGRILVSRRPEGVAHAGCWELPGGKLELGESLSAALVREIREELAITVEPGPVFGRVKHKYPAVTVLITGLHALYTTGEPQALGVAEFRWLRPSELTALDFPEANARLFASDWQSPPVRWMIRSAEEEL